MGFYIPRRALSPSSINYKKGIHRGHTSGLPGVDTDLIAANIKYNVTLFGIAGTMVSWLTEINKSKSVLALPTKSIAILEDHSGGAFTSTPALTVPAPATKVASAENSMVVVDSCEAAWDEYVQANVTSTLETTDVKVGSGSAKLDVGATAAVGRLATHDFASLNGTAYNYIKFWIKSTVTINSGDLSILLDDTAECVSPLKDLNMGALTANTWTEKSLALGDASGLGALISVGIDMDVDKGAFVLYIDQIRLTKGV
jgi:hypothetical protein